jgi:Mg2+-importing ATPase
MKNPRWILWLALIACGVLVIRSFTDFRTLLATLLTGHWPWLLAAMLLHLLFFVPYARLYQVAFATVCVKSRLRDLVALVFAAVFANAVVPAGGVSAAALFIDDAVRRRQSGAAAAVGTILVLIADLLTLIPFLVIGMFALWFRHELKLYDVIGGVIFVIFVAGLCGGLILARWRRAWLLCLLLFAERLGHRVGRRVKRPDLVSAHWAERNAAELSAASEALWHHPRRLGALLSLGLLVHCLGLASLAAVFQAYRQPIGLGPLAAGFGLGIVFWVIAMVPQGVCATEGIMALVFASLGVSRSKAITIVLVFRGMNYYLPLLIGSACLRRVRPFTTGSDRRRGSRI